MARLYNYESNAYETIEDEKVKDAVASGAYGFAKDAEVNIVLPNGQPYKIHGSDAFEAFKMGAQFESKEAATNRAFKQEYGSGLGNAMLAFGAGLGRGVTFGISDAMLSTVVDPKILQTYQEEFGGLSLTGEIGGAILPAFFTAGGGALGTAARLTPAGRSAMLSTRLGEKAGEATFKKIAADSLARKVGQTGVSLMVAGAVDSGIYESGMELSELITSDKPKAASDIIANVGLSALLGGALGGALGSGAVLGVAGTKKTATSIKSMFEKTLDMPMVNGASDMLAQAVSTMTGEPVDVVRKLIRPGKSGLDEKRVILNDVDAAKQALEDIKAERYALSVQKVRNRVNKIDEQINLDNDIDMASLSLAEEKTVLAKKRQAFVRELRDDDVELIIQDMEINGKLDELNADKNAVKELTIEEKRQFINDNFEMLQKHNAEKASELSQLDALNTRAIDIRERMLGIKNRGADSIDSLRSQLRRHKEENLLEIDDLRKERRDFVERFDDSEIELGLKQLREQGMLTEDLFNLDKLSAAKKREFAIDNAEYLFRQADDEARRSVMFSEIQEKVIADQLHKIDVTDRINATREAMKGLQGEQKDEMGKLIADAEGYMSRIGDRAVIDTNALLESAEQLSVFMQRRGGEPGADKVKAGFFDELLPKLVEPAPAVAREMRDEARNYWSKIEDTLEGIRDDIDKDLSSALGTRLNEVSERLTDALDGNLPVDVMFKELDDAKRQIQEVLYSKPVKDSAAFRGISDVRTITDGFNSILTNEKYFGKAAVDMYKDVNQAISHYIRARDAIQTGLTAKAFKPELSSRAGSITPFANNREARIAAVHNMVRSASVTNLRKGFDLYRKQAENLADVFERYFKGKGEEFDAVLGQFRNGAKGLEESFNQATLARNSLEAYRMVTGRKIQVKELPDFAQQKLSNYTRRAQEIDELGQKLGALTRERSRIGGDTLAESKRFAAETKQILANKKAHSGWLKTGQLKQLDDLAKSRLPIARQLDSLKQEKAKQKLASKGEKTKKLNEIDAKIKTVQAKMRSIDNQSAAIEATIKKSVRDELSKETSGLSDLKKAMLSEKSTLKIKEQFRKEEVARLKARHQETILELETEMLSIRARQEVARAKVKNARNVYKTKKAVKKGEITDESEALKVRAAEIQEEITKRRAELRAADKITDKDVNEQLLALMQRELAAKETLRGIGAGYDGVGAAMLAGAVGSVPFGLGGGMAAATIAAMSKPTTFARANVAIWDLIDGTEKALVENLDHVIDVMFNKARPRKTTQSNVLPSFLAPIGALVDAETAAERQEEYEVVVDRLNQLTTNPALQAKVFEEIAEPFGERKELGQEVVRQVSGQVQYIKEHAPKVAAVNPTQLFQRRQKAPDSEIRKFAEICAVAEDPVRRICENLQNNTISYAEIDYLKVAHSSLYERMAVYIMEKASDRVADGEVLSDAYKRTMHKFLPADVAPGMMTGQLAVTQGVYKAEPQAPAPRKRLEGLQNQANRATLPLQTAMT
tara:strand:+ start:2273 stop:6805 length:4533 start_codon:yes stop_codon:yes gene_type:complete